MSRQQIRPSFADLTDYEDLAFPEYNSAEPPAVTVSRSTPPNIVNSSSQFIAFHTRIELI